MSNHHKTTSQKYFSVHFLFKMCHIVNAENDVIRINFYRIYAPTYKSAEQNSLANYIYIYI